jgi:DNA polymerase III subunit alpha
MPQFCHLHCHSQYSLLDGASSIKNMFKKASADGMPAIALTDHGNMFGAFAFVAEANKHKGVKPIVGCEFYLVKDRHKQQFTKDDKDKRFHQLFLAKNDQGYKNLTKLCSLGFIEGLYGKYPRIDKELVEKYHEGLIATTCCIGASVPQAILKKGEEEARKEFEWWLNIFGDDYYIELQRHHMPEQEKVNEVLIRWSKEYNVKMIASNDSHYIDQADSNAHDILLCINTGEKQSTPLFKDFDDNNPMPKGSRFGFFNDQFYFKTQAEMGILFADQPQALENTIEVADKCDHLNLKRDIMLPNFIVPSQFATQDDYLRDLTYLGAKERYKDLTAEVTERLDFELNVVKTMGFAGYFLIVADFIKAGRDLGVFIGPGRGSAAGSAIAYCIGITNIDPLKYKLLFERFLNPDRIGMPDIDTDFDDEGRQKVIDYVVDKYGKQQVAHIVTYSSMAAKVSIKDVSRVLDLPLDRANIMAKLVPDKPGISLNRVLTANIDGEGGLRDKESLQSEDIEAIKQLRELHTGFGEESKVLAEALRLEGSVRGTGIHAAGIIIAPCDLTDIIPVCQQRDISLLITQYEGSIIEDVGVIKMDFLGLKTLTVLKDALALIKENHGIVIDLDTLELDDAATYELYQRGETNGTFQFESPGMQKYLRELKPDKFDDLIAMNALYRPGPIEYIPNFIARKHGREEVVYDIPELAEYLEETYGITVYQEQIMLLSQKLAGFGRGDADVLRKAMGKKQKDVLDKMKKKFIEGATAKGLPADKLDKIWTDWEAFASYAFNKSHSTCYALVAYHTAYLKAHYPGEFMSAVLTNNLGQIDKITFFMEECKRMGIPVKGPDVNESAAKFTVNKRGEIRYALGAIKGVGEGVVENIVSERRQNGSYKSIFDFVRRCNLRTLNKRVMEVLAWAGALDEFGDMHRAQFFTPSGPYDTYIEHLLKYGNAQQSQAQSASTSLFGDMMDDISVPEPPAPAANPWPLIYSLDREREVTGIFLSGHPLDDYRIEVQSFTTHTLSQVPDLPLTQKARLAGFVIKADHRISQRGTGWGRFTLQDYNGALEITLFNESYLKFKHLLEAGSTIFLTGSNELRFGQPGTNEFKVSDIKQLAAISGTMTDRITIHIPTDRIDEGFITDFEVLCKGYPGPHKVKVLLMDPVNRIALPFISSTIKVQADSRFVQEINKMELECKLQ